VKKAVEANLGVAFVSEYSVDREMKLGTLRILTVEGFHLVRALEMFWRRGMKLGPTAAPLLDMATSHLDGAAPLDSVMPPQESVGMPTEEGAISEL
jgi:DNA-binding transcriptional LysR family regulator